MLWQLRRHDRNRRRETEGVSASEDPEEPPLSDHEKEIRRWLADIARTGFHGNRHVELDVHTMELGIPPAASLTYIQKAGKDYTDMHIRGFGVDPKLQRRGIGSLLLIKTLQHNLEYNPYTETISTSPVSAGQVGVIQRVFGEENLILPEGATIDDSFIASGVRAHVDRTRIERINVSSKLQELADTGRVTITI